MKNKKIWKIMIVMFTLLIACKKEDKGSTNDTPTPPPTPTPVVKPKSKMELLNQIWILKETFENGVQKTSNGTGRYEFNKFGNFRAELSGTFQDIGTYKFTNTDSNELKVVLIGSSSPYYWKLVKFDEKNLNTEFMSGSTKNNYNYTR